MSSDLNTADYVIDLVVHLPQVPSQQDNNKQEITTSGVIHDIKSKQDHPIPEFTTKLNGQIPGINLQKDCLIPLKLDIQLPTIPTKSNDPIPKTDDPFLQVNSPFPQVNGPFPGFPSQTDGQILGIPPSKRIRQIPGVPSHLSSQDTHGDGIITVHNNELLTREFLKSAELLQRKARVNNRPGDHLTNPNGLSKKKVSFNNRIENNDFDTLSSDERKVAGDVSNHHHEAPTMETNQQKSPDEQLIFPPIVSQSVYSHYKKPGIQQQKPTNVRFSQQDGPKHQFSDDIWYKHHQITRQYIHGPDLLADVYNNNKRNPTTKHTQMSKFNPNPARGGQHRYLPQITQLQRSHKNITASLPDFSAVENQYQLLGTGFRENPFRWQRKHLYHRAWKWFV